jgi:hypothetical protein
VLGGWLTGNSDHDQVSAGHARRAEQLHGHVAMGDAPDGRASRAVQIRHSPLHARRGALTRTVAKRTGADDAGHGGWYRG